ncbi:MAG: sulfotransferase [Gammaproteobacteria bacterium]
MEINVRTRIASQKLALPESPAVRMMRRGAAAHNRGETAQAEQIYGEITRRFPEFADAWHYLGTLLHERGEARAAREALERAAQLTPRDPVLLRDMAIVLRAQKDYAGSLQAIERAYDCAERPEEILEQHARTLLEIERGYELIEPLRRYFAHYGENWMLRTLFGECLVQGGMPDEAGEAFSRAVETAPPEETWVALKRADFNLSRERFDAARTEYLRLRARFPKAPAPRIGLAVLAAQAGDFAETEKLARKALALDSRSWYAWLLRVRVVRPEECESLVEELEKAAVTAGDDPSVWRLHVARGTIQERLGNYDRAFAAYTQANAQLGSMHRVAENSLKNSLVELRSNLGPAFLDRAEAISVADPGVIFVCGMPRSGTTLVETILASHPRVKAGGEMRYIHDKLKRTIGPHRPFGSWLAEADDATLKAIATEWAEMLAAKKGNQGLVTDKMPGNFTLLGFIHVCFPDARIVYVQRDPRDNCLSYFTTPFALGNEYSYTLANTAKYYKYHTELMAHWRSVLGPERIVEVRYEDVVEHPERETRKLLASLGLEWDPRCLDFHKTRRQVTTASQFQVRKPLYTNSVGRWRRFEKHLAPLLAELDKPFPDASASGSTSSSATPDSSAGASTRIPAEHDNPERHMQAGETARESGNQTLAKAEFEAVLAINPGSAGAHFELGRLASEEGDFQRAEVLLRQAIELAPNWYRPWNELSMIKSATPPAEFVKELDTVIGNAADDPESWLLYFARGRVRERLGDYDGAFADYAEGNRPRGAGPTYLRKGQSEYARDIIMHLDRSFVSRRLAPVSNVPRPIFVCGMYRSGTTLVETILASHPEVGAGGEMRYIHDYLLSAPDTSERGRPGTWLASRSDAELGTMARDWQRHLVEQAAGQPWITDKMPPNYSLLGLIQVCFPDAPIIHVHRDPRDTCFSCFATPFVDSHSFSHTLADTGHFYRLYERYLRHWRETLAPERIIEVEYESLVRKPEAEIRRLVAAVGLEWDARCLEFYRASHNVRTESVAQVRRPMYTSSLGRWHHFERHLGPLLTELETPLPPFAPRATSRFVPPPQAVQEMQAAVAAQRQGNFAAAETAFRELVRTYPRFPDARHFLGLLLYQKGEKNTSLQLLDEAQSLDPDNVGFLLNYARALRETWHLAEAADCLERAHRLDPNHTPTLFTLAQTLVALNRGGEFAAEIESRLQANQNDWRVWMLLGQCREQAGDIEGALDALDEARRRAPASESAPHLIRGAIAKLDGRRSIAEKEFEAALAIDPKSANVLFNIGQLAAEEGDFPRAESLLRQAVAADPDLYAAWEWLSLIGSDTPSEALAREFEEVAGRAGDGPSSSLLRFSIGREREKLGRYDEAFAAYAQGNRMRANLFPYSRPGDLDHTRDIIENLNEGFAARRLGGVASSAVPIFVCGMPRSGTTLVETILASHPRVAAGGEMRYIHNKLRRENAPETGIPVGQWLAKTDDAALAAITAEWSEALAAKGGAHGYVTDKMPGNYMLLGLIHVCFPAAPIIHVRRDARDTCFSCFATAFMQGNEFSNDLGNAGYRYRLYERLMRHWREVLGAARIIEIEYETLVREPETEIRRLLEAIGLEWDARCLTFHETGRNVQTASVAQIRRPLYASSIGRWRHFERHLGPLVAELEAPPIP